ncbi:GNAT family N-acetyltransferase [Parvularcula marina]|nr:GNAT family N-acetyltransferase [Parvularcula marina]
MTELSTARMTLRPPRDEDGPDAVRYLDDHETARMLARVPHPYTMDDWNGFMENVVRNGDEDVLALTDKASGAFMGVISFQTDEDEPVLGYWLGAPFRGRGFMKEAGLAFVRHGFAKLAVPSMISGHFIDNPASGRVLNFLGFEEFEIDLVTALSRGPEPVRHVTMRLTNERFDRLHPAG